MVILSDCFIFNIMIPLIKLREDMRFTQELQEMIDVLKGATAGQFRSLQQRRRGFELFKTVLSEFVLDISSEGAGHPFLRELPDLPKAILIVTSDEGFVGGLNASVIQAGLDQAGPSDELFVLGERGVRFLSESQRLSFTALPGIGEDITYQRAVAIREMLIARFLARKVGKVLVSYPRFVSLTQQIVEVSCILPCVNIFGKGKDSKKKAQLREPLIEPSRFRVIDYMFKVWMMQKLYDIFWESKLSECAARIIHLEGSHEEIANASKKLIYEYFKQVHGKSDKNIREIFASCLRKGDVAAQDEEDKVAVVSL